MRKRAKAKASLPPGVQPALLTQEQAALYLAVSARYLRESSCPKVLLPGNGERGKPLVRYEPAEVRAWLQARRVTLGRAS